MINISWIIPVYKGKNYIPGLLKNMQEVYDNMRKSYTCTECDMEVVIINDDPSEIIELQKCSFAVYLIQHQENRGIHQARITGLQAAQGEYIVYLDQDDHVAPEFLTLHLKAIGSADVCVSNGYREFPNRKELLYTKKTAMKLTGQYKVYLYGTDMIFSPGQCLIKKSSIPALWTQKVMKVNGCDDFFLWILLFHSKAEFIYLWEPLYFHRETEQNLSNNSSHMDSSFEEMIKILETENVIPIRDANVLKKRLFIKQTKRKNMHKALWKMMLSPGILYYTLKYKLNGYR